MRTSIHALAFLSFAAAPIVAAAPAPASPVPGSNPNPGDVVELSAFEVASTANRGYVTTSSLTASRTLR